MRINAQLNDAATGNEMCAERFDGSLQDIFGLRDRITRKVVSPLAVNLTAAESQRITSQDTQNL